ncbi:hypothetical protein BG262_09615 [Floricoccus penangensis]|uniref:Transposase IS204/IS1001/IS1096/IS1165 DDE domain-containing protein n=2 Tax=Floricoccus penangensis TaxID=1859475 RepID=A0A9Q5JHB6_9LACT|nr:hypothetical protein BG262_09615 [Floricoccus penangensis]
MAFIAMDGVTHQLHNLIDDRRIYSLTNHFLQYPHSEKIKVKYLVMDMNASYERLIKVAFPNAKIITDRFHVVQQITRAFNVLRVKGMNKFNRNNDIEKNHYKRLKWFWKLLLKDYDDLSNDVFYSKIRTSSACVEGTNNKIKMIKRTVFGYRRNLHLFARVMLCQEININ